VHDKPLLEGIERLIRNFDAKKRDIHPEDREST
jgi:hypothetical protein